MQLHVNHRTQYTYDQPVDYALQKVRLHPLTSTQQDVCTWDMVVEGGKIEASYLDHHGNHTDLVSIEPGTQTLTITASGTVVTSDTSGVLGHVYGCAPLWHFAQSTMLTRPGDQVRALLDGLSKNDTRLDRLHALSAAVLQATPYQLGTTTTDTTAEDSLTTGSGVCQDHAHIFITAARLAGFPARYISGYLMINDRIDQDATHAWAEAHLDDLGWVGFDVSNGVAPDEKYVRIAIGRDAVDAAPTLGMRMGASDEAMIVSLQVQQ